MTGTSRGQSKTAVKIATKRIELKKLKPIKNHYFYDYD